MTTATHSQVGASSCERWWNCPGSVLLIATLPPAAPSSFADEGTVAHLVCEWALRTERMAWDYIGQVAYPVINKKTGQRYEFKGDAKKGEYVLDAGITVTEEMAEAVQVYLDVIRADQKQFGGELEIEKQFVLTQIHPDARGTNDANLGVFLMKLIVYDFKYGKGLAVDAESNKQLMYYGLGAIQEGDYDQIELVIVQPRAIHRDGPIRRWSLSRSELLAFGGELKSRIQDTEKPEAPIQCGEHCKDTFCPALAVCPAVRAHTQVAARMAFDAPQQQLPDPAELSGSQLRKLLDTIPLIDAYVKAVEKYAEEKVNRGGKIEGYKLVEKRSNRQWKDEAAVKKAFPEVEETRIEVISPAKLEAKLKTLMTVKEAKATVDQYTHKPPAGTVLVPESDPREGVRPSIETAFVEEVDIFS